MMDMKEGLRELLQEMVVPDLGRIKEENSKISISLDYINKRLDDVNKRLDDVNAHLVDQSRRIDNLRAELTERIDETNKRIDDVKSELNERIDDVKSDLFKLIVDVRAELGHKIDQNNMRMDRLTEAIVRREEHQQLEARLGRVEGEISLIKERIAA